MKNWEMIPTQGKKISTGVRPEVIYSQKNVSDGERMKRLSIPGPVNLGHLPPPGVPKEDEYRELDRQQTYLKENSLLSLSIQMVVHSVWLDSSHIYDKAEGEPSLGSR